MEIELAHSNNFVHTKFVCFNREVGAEEESHTHCGDYVTNNQHNPAHPQRIKGLGADDEHPHIDEIAVYDCSQKGQQIAPVESFYYEAGQKNDKALHQIFYDSD